MKDSRLRSGDLTQINARPSSSAAVRGSSLDTHQRHRVMAVKVDIDWRSDADRALFQRLRDLAWQAAHYRNWFIRSKVAAAMGWKSDFHQTNGIEKEIRSTKKGELSGAAYSAAEREVASSWTRDHKRILAGQPLPEWSPAAALSVRGHKKKNESGVRLETEDTRYIAYVQVQNKDCEGGSWLRLPLAKHTERDEYHGDTLRRMVNWETPIEKATIHLKRHGIVLRLTYSIPVALPAVGNRVATLGPVEKDGRLHLRTETQTKDYTSKLYTITERKNAWDLTRRRVLAQIGWRKGHARTKRRVLERLSWDNWLQTYLHVWSREITEWLHSQGVGTLKVQSIENGDWPAHKFVAQLKYKCEDYRIALEEGANLEAASSDRAMKSAVRKLKKDVQTRNRALRDLTHNLKEKQA